MQMITGQVHAYISTSAVGGRVYEGEAKSFQKRQNFN